MPRYSGFFPGEIANLKQNATDIIYDFAKVYSSLAEYYSEYLDSKHIKEFKDSSKMLAKIKPSKPACKNRIYITTNFTFVSLMVIDFDEPVIQNLKQVCELIQNQKESSCFDGDYYGILWIFEGTELTHMSFLSTKTVATLVSVFHKENLVNVGNFRDGWVSEPRRRFTPISEN